MIFKFRYRFSKLLFFGSDEFSLPILKSLVNQHKSSKFPFLNSILVITQSQSGSSQKFLNPVEKYCSENNLQLMIPISNMENKKEQWDIFAQSLGEFDYGLIASYGLMIPSSVIKICKKHFIVCHPSLLPKYRGAAPIQHAILNNDAETGVSFVRISEGKFDAGEIVLQRQLEIDEKDNYFSLRDKLSKMSCVSLESLLINLHEGKNDSRVQDENLVTKAPKLSIDDTIIDFKQCATTSIIQKFKAFSGSSLTCIRTRFQGELLMLEEIEILEQKEIDYLFEKFGNEISPGKIVIVKAKSMKNFIFVKTIDSWIKIMKLKLSSKPSFSALQFINKFIDRTQYFENNNSNNFYSFS